MYDLYMLCDVMESHCGVITQVRSYIARENITDIKGVQKLLNSEYFCIYILPY